MSDQLAPEGNISIRSNWATCSSASSARAAHKGATAEFIELYNNTNAPIQVSSGDGSAGWSIIADISHTPTIVATISNGTNIPAGVRPAKPTCVS
ncbi:MAG: hypothetical protein DMF64_11810 [Acidobacteria bacterium]|nr:MAG: hypothetical protein DMF64_11810 [Acidobacteriota bacterium]